MATIQVTACDECLVQKGDVNHWFFAVTYGPAVEFKKMANLIPGEDTPDAHFCSQGCTMKVFGRWMDTGSIDKPSGELVA